MFESPQSGAPITIHTPPKIDAAPWKRSHGQGFDRNCRGRGQRQKTVKRMKNSLSILECLPTYFQM